MLSILIMLLTDGQNIKRVGNIYRINLCIIVCATGDTHGIVSAA